VNACDDKQKEFLVRASYLEIYNEEIRDLLGKDPKAKLELKSNPDKGVYVKGLTNIVVKTVEEIDHVLQVE
jgi:phage-related protein